MVQKIPEPAGKDKAFEMDGRKFILFIFLPLLLAFAILFIAYAPDKPLGGPMSPSYKPE